MVKTYKNVLTKEECDKIIEISQSLVISKVEHQMRICSGTVICSPLVNNERILAIPEIIKKYAEEYFAERGISEYTMEDVQLIHYDKGEGFFARHQDGMGRIASVILYLNEVEEGGKTVFYLDNTVYSVTPEPGKLIFFGADVDHEATIPLSGAKHIAVTWFK